jgi:hypothetical protein
MKLMLGLTFLHQCFLAIIVEHIPTSFAESWQSSA